MRIEAGNIRLSASDLMRFQSCAHAISLDLFDLKNPGQLKAVPDAEESKLVQAKGNEHEKAFLTGLKSSGATVFEIERAATFGAAVEKTVSALKAGPDYVFQAALDGNPWGGYADFLIKTDTASRLGPFSYEVIDTKLKRSIDPKHILQLVLYSDLLASVQGLPPQNTHLILGDGRKETLRLSDYQYYARHSRARLEAFTVDAWETRPEPVSACALCKWRDHCAAEWDTTDSLSIVAGITKGQKRKLEAAGVKTLTGLSEIEGRVARLAEETLAKLRTQAGLQHARRSGEPPSFKRKAIEPGRGLSRLPTPNDGDLFFDMEGDPYYEGGLEYLFGVHGKSTGGYFFKDFWAHDRKEEAKATADILAFFAQHLKQYPKANIYHYNHYEVTALKRLSSFHGTGEAILDQFLREQRFVDLYRVVQAGLFASEPGYSIKDLEVFYMEKRSGDVASAGASVVAYENWRTSQESKILDDIREYNKTDCVSTELLRNWLIEKVRPTELPWYEVPVPEGNSATTNKLVEAEAEQQLWHTILDGSKGLLGPEIAQLLFDLAFFHKREDKPGWWAMFDRAERESEELIDDLDCLGGLQAIGPSVPQKKSFIRDYRFPPQETKLRADSKAKARAGLKNLTIEEFSAINGMVKLKFGPSFGQPPNSLDLIPAGPIPNSILIEGLRRVIEAIAKGDKKYRAAQDLIQRHVPRFQDAVVRSTIIEPDGDLVGQTVAAIVALDHSVLAIQGPPGTGKTYVSAVAIAELLALGYRVGVSSNSHKAIDNLLVEAAKKAKERGISVHAVKKVSNDDQAPDLPGIEVTTSNEDPSLLVGNLVGGTAWLFARHDYDQAFDYVFIDEAGQVSLANTLAIASCAKNLVLVGDPMQLPQPIQGVHPGDSGLSSLDYLFKGHHTVPPDRGIFLPKSRRMHPNICRYISDIVYDSRLDSIPETAKQSILLPESLSHFTSAGIRFVEINHFGNGQSSAEEVAAILETYERLRQGEFIDRNGGRRLIGIDDILVVAPYNAQVNALTTALPQGARVGTVDKFQGQEAPVCIVSMTTSSGDEMPRDIEFLFSLNRINVAISRAQATALVFASPLLLEIPCASANQMRLVNALCGVRAY